MLVKQWMQENVITVNQEDTIEKARGLMEEENIRRIPVINTEKKLVGIISKEDIKMALPSVVDSSIDKTSRALANQVKVETFMSHSPIHLKPADTLERAAAIMQKHKIGGVPVLEDNILVGIITESDIFKAFTEIMGLENKDTRIEFSIDHNKSLTYEVFDVLSSFDASVNNIVFCNNYSSTRKYVTLRIDSKYIQEIADGLRQIGCIINSILPES